MVFAGFFDLFTGTPPKNSPPAEHAVLALTVSVGSNSPVCSGNTLTLSSSVTGGGSGPYTYVWSGPAGFTATVQNPARNNTIVAHSGMYSVTVTEPASGMTGTASVDVTISQAATANAGPDHAYCLNVPAQLQGAIGGSASSATWTASVPGGTFNPNNTTLNAVYTPPLNFDGEITLTLTTNDPAGVCLPVFDQVTLAWDLTGAIVCNNLLNLSLDENCEAVILPDVIIEGDIYDDLYSVEVFAPNGTSLGNVITGAYLNTTLTAKVTDLCNGNMCTGSITVSDEIDPVFISCDSIELPCGVTDFSPAYLSNTLGIAAAYPDVEDNCGSFQLVHSDNWVMLGCNGTFNGINNLSSYVIRTWTATDNSGNSASCTQFLYFKRIQIAGITLPADLTLTDCANPNTNTSVTGIPTYIWGNFNIPLYPGNGSCGLNIQFQDNTIAGCGGTRTVFRTWTLYNPCEPNVQGQNPKNHLQVITITDNAGPVIDCPNNLTVNMDPLDCCASVDLPDVLIWDGCSGIIDATVKVTTLGPNNQVITLYTGLAFLQPIVSGFPNDTLAVFGTTPCLPQGTHTVTYTAEDKCGQSSVCTFLLTVVDQVPPVPACDEITQVVLGLDGMALINASTFDDGSYDNCGTIYFKARRQDANSCQPNNKFYDQVKFCCEDLDDTVTVILRVYDVFVPAGAVNLNYEEAHSNECQVKVYVDDNLKPVCVPPANTTVSCENFDPTLWVYGEANGVDNCCVDTVTTSVNYAQFDTACSRGTIIRTFRVFDCSGNTNQCTQRIVVNFDQEFYVKFPDDVIVNDCNGTGIYGQPQFAGEDCELLGVSYTDEFFTVVPDACLKIERTWTIINWCTYDPNLGSTYVPNPNPNQQSNHLSNMPGPIVSPQGTPAPWAPTVVKVSPNDPSPTNYSTFYSPTTNSYKYKQIIKIVDGEAPEVLSCPTAPVEICDISANDPQLWNEPYWFDPVTGLSDLGEAATDLSIQATDDCSNANINIRYLLFLDLDQNGSMETVISSINPPAAGTVQFDNANTPNFTGGTSRIFDERNVPLNLKYRFALETAINGNVKTATIRWNTAALPNSYVAPQLPYGTHKVKWIVSDGCGNEKVCEYTFVVEDCAPPTVTCINGLSTPIMVTQMATVNLVDFLAGAVDNYLPSNQLIYSMRQSGTGNGFPLDNNGNPVTQLTFGCWAVGTVPIQIWAMDAAGNADYCETYLIIQDNSGFCGPGSDVSVAGALLTEEIDGLEDGFVEIQGFNPAGPAFNMFQMTNSTGDYLFSHAVPLFSDYLVTPSKDDNPLNGVSTYDLVLISRHILGLQPLGSPYKMIAADANKNGSITTADIVELRKLILGVYDELPNNGAWRFVDKSFAFPDQNNPFVTAFPESKSVASIQADQMTDDFVAIKVGDVNGTAIPNSLFSLDERSFGTLYLDLEDRSVKAGEVFRVQIRSAEPALGYQFTFSYEHLECLEIVPLKGINDDHFALFPKENAITTSFFGPETTEFELVFKANSDGNLRDLLSLSSRITKAEAYSLQGDRMDVVLRFNRKDGSVTAGVGFELYQNMPNPFINKTLIGFHLPQAAETTFSVYDDMGRIIHTQTAYYGKGYNMLAIESDMLNTAGLLYYKLQTATDSAVRTMVRMR